MTILLMFSTYKKKEIFRKKKHNHSVGGEDARGGGNFIFHTMDSKNVLCCCGCLLERGCTSEVTFLPKHLSAITGICQQLC